MAWGDWDRDGDLDLAAGNNQYPNQIFENLGGKLSLAWTFSPWDGTRDAALVDWDHDSDLDLAVANYEGPSRIPFWATTLVGGNTDKRLRR